MFSSNTTQVSDGGYQISRSLRFNSADSAYLNRTPASAGNRKTWTWSAWVKRSSLATTQQLFTCRPTSSPYALIYFDSTNNQLSYDDTGSLGFTTNAVFRDVSAWYHIVIAIDTTQATSTNRIKVYINNVQQTFSSSNYGTQNFETQINTATEHKLGTYSSEFFNGYMTDVNFIDGQALTPSSFGETNAQTGVWQPKAYSGSYGTNGFYLNFSDNSNTTAATLGKDYSGNGNNWTPNGFLVSAGVNNDSLVDSPTSYGTDTGVGGTVRGNYCTFNAVDKGTSITLSNGNLDFAQSGAGSDCARATFAIPSSGKWYWETFVSAVGSGCNIGIATSTTSLTAGGAITGVLYQYSGYKSINSWSNDGSYGSAYTTNDLIGIAVDMDAGTITFYKNGSSLGAAYSSLSSAIQYLPFFQGTGTTWIANFGQRPFAYTAPSGFKALCTQNLPTPTIGATTATLASKYFAPTLYTGNGTSQTITTGFMPNLVWIKSRSNAQSHFLHNNVDNVSLYLSSNNTSAEGYDTTTVTAISSTGFSLGTESNHNGNGNTYVAWGWNASGSSGGTTNTAGSITSTVSANTTSGFSVVTYTGNGTSGASVGHGLGVTPAMVIIKQRTATDGWLVYHQSVSSPTSNYLALNTTAASASASGWLTPSSSTLTFTTSYGGTNGNGLTMVAYCFAEVAGYSKFGSYTGNNSADGPFVYLGFKPKFVLIKDTGTVGNWWIGDGTRSTYNVVAASLLPNLSNAESSAYNECDFLSNGFKWRATDANSFPNNVNGNTYIYMAFAENPFKFSLAR